MARQPRHTAVDSALSLLARPAAAAWLTPAVQRVKAACSSTAFQTRFSEAAARAGDAVTSMRDVQQLAHVVLDEMEVDHRGVFLTFAWDPETRGLEMFFRPVPPAERLPMAAAEEAHP